MRPDRGTRDRQGPRVSASQVDKAEAFRALHSGEPFLFPNPWDAESARGLANLGFKALASTSGGYAERLGRSDGEVTLDESVEHARELNEATDLPVAMDLENGYAAEPAKAALAVTAVAEAGAVGGSIEDWDPDDEVVYCLEHAVARIEAAAEAARALDFPSLSRPVPRISSGASTISATRSLASTPTPRPAPTFSTPPDFARTRRCAPFATPSRNRSTFSPTQA